MAKRRLAWTWSDTDPQMKIGSFQKGRTECGSFEIDTHLKTVGWTDNGCLWWVELREAPDKERRLAPRFVVRFHVTGLWPKAKATAMEAATTLIEAWDLVNQLGEPEDVD